MELKLEFCGLIVICMTFNLAQIAFQKNIYAHTIGRHTVQHEHVHGKFAIGMTRCQCFGLRKGREGHSPVRSKVGFVCCML